jgi:hypothetical protein
MGFMITRGMEVVGGREKFFILEILEYFIGLQEMAIFDISILG